MNTKNIKSRLTDLSQLFIFVLIIIQPLLDVLSYFLVEAGNTTVTTLLRMAMFAVIVLYAFLMADNRKSFYIMAGVLAGYWVLHVAACFSEGYQSIFSDLANYIRFIQIPVLALCFSVFFKAKNKIAETFGAACAINMGTISLVVILSVVTGNINYTYSIDKLGYLGWFSVGNAQSMIVALLAILAVYWAYSQERRRWLFPTVLVISCTNLFTLGTKVTYFTIFIIGAGFLFSALFTRCRRPECYISLVLVVALAISMYPMSVMSLRNYKHEDAFDSKEDLIEDLIEDDLENSHSGESDQEKVNGIYLSTYQEIYEPYCGEMIEIFGLSRVLEKYNYTTDASTLANQRAKKQNFAQLCWEDSSALTHLFGYEYETLIGDKEIYDLENDFPSVFYYYGYVGFAMFVAFLAYFAALIVLALIKNFKQVFTVEAVAVGLVFVLMLGAAQFSGNVLRRPNVSIYLSFVLAYIYYLTTVKQGVTLFSMAKKRPQPVETDFIEE